MKDSSPDPEEGLPMSPKKDSSSLGGSTSSLNNNESDKFCKICHCGAEASNAFIKPCLCSGSLKFVHQQCLQHWIKSSDTKSCELCKHPFTMSSKVGGIVAGGRICRGMNI